MILTVREKHPLHHLKFYQSYLLSASSVLFVTKYDIAGELGKKINGEKWKRSKGKDGGNGRPNKLKETTKDKRTVEVKGPISPQVDAETLRENGILNTINWTLRHGAVKVGLELDERGYANCGELVSDKYISSGDQFLDYHFRFLYVCYLKERRGNAPSVPTTYYLAFVTTLHEISSLVLAF